MMADGFERTRETATQAAATHRLLMRAADRSVGGDRRRLTALAGRYEDYARALLETVAGADEPVDLDQAPLFVEAAE